MCNPSFDNGYQLKSQEIKETRWNEARERFNEKYPPGVAFMWHNENERQYANGQYQALCDNIHLWND